MRSLALTLVFFLPDAAAGTGAVEVTLRAQSVVGETYFRLGEIATVRAADAALERELAALRIGRSPRAGTALALKAPEVERAIARLKPELKERIRVSAAPHASVRRGPLQTLELARVRELATAALEAFLAERASRFEIEALGEAEGLLALPPGRVELRPRIASEGPIPARIGVWTDVHVDGARYQSLPLSFTVRAYRPALVARTALPAGRPLRAGDFASSEQQVAGHAESPVPPATDLTRLRLKRALGAGEMLTWGHADQAPAVSRDQEIVVRLAAGAIALETAAVALRDGRPGEVIRVRSSASRQSFPARVTGAGTAEALWR
jgi:flagellar basal body P-ring formation protein FlgA